MRLPSARVTARSAWPGRRFSRNVSRRVGTELAVRLAPRFGYLDRTKVGISPSSGELGSGATAGWVREAAALDPLHPGRTARRIIPIQINQVQLRPFQTPARIRIDPIRIRPSAFISDKEHDSESVIDYFGEDIMPAMSKSMSPDSSGLLFADQEILRASICIATLATIPSTV